MPIPRVPLQAQIHTGFHCCTEIGRFFIINILLLRKKNTFQVEMWPISRLNDSEIQERGLERVKNPKTFFRSLPPDPSRSLHLWRSFRKSVSICTRSAPALFCLLSNKVVIVNHLLLAQCLGFHSLVVKTVSQVVLVKASRQKWVKFFKNSS